MRKDEAQRPDDVGRRLEQALALEQGLAYEAKLVILEIAQAAMDQLGAGRRRIAGEVALLAKNHRKATADRIPGDTRAVDAAADDEKIGYCRHERVFLRNRTSRPFCK